MRKLSAILLLCNFLFLTAGYQVLYGLRIAEARQAMKASLLATRTESLTQLVFSENDWASFNAEQNEFRFNGVMYDVLKTEKAKGQVHAWCLPDTKETALVDSYLSTQKTSTEHQSILRLLATQFLPSSACILNGPATKAPKPVSRFIVRLPDLATSLLKPPPQGNSVRS